MPAQQLPVPAGGPGPPVHRSVLKKGAGERNGHRPRPGRPGRHAQLLFHRLHEVLGGQLPPAAPVPWGAAGPAQPHHDGGERREDHSKQGTGEQPQVGAPGPCGVGGTTTSHGRHASRSYDRVAWRPNR